MNSLLINNLKIQLNNLTHLLNTDRQKEKKRGRKARSWFGLHSMATTINCHTSKNMTMIPTDIIFGLNTLCSAKYCCELHLE
ncbi:hypothetical protein E2C01_014445 [Portunus trituberculatus]|uniref:Uncharacterized protein n=1 Tax=Portunus trituberculatus TaxID=210409 RepID=A0A5B7DJ82_PORTR|nr:hypothetical protein [Portunus trituberculatus]